MANKFSCSIPDSRRHGDDSHTNQQDDFGDFASEKAKDEERVYDPTSARFQTKRWKASSNAISKDRTLASPVEKANAKESIKQQANSLNHHMTPTLANSDSRIQQAKIANHLHVTTVVQTHI